jgi:hypothetical protein
LNVPGNFGSFTGHVPNHDGSNVALDGKGRLKALIAKSPFRIGDFENPVSDFPAVGRTQNSDRADALVLDEA